MNRAFIAFGGNLGHVAESFRQARQQLDTMADCQVTSSSLLYRTPPMGPPGQPDYLNAVVELLTSMKPLPLLAALQQIEGLHGRERSQRWAARTLDLDILAMDALLVDDDRLQLPHPEMQNRQFVLRPLCDIAPNWQHPRLGKTASALLEDLLRSGEAALAEGETW